MTPPDSPTAPQPQGRWTSLWIVALLSLLGHLALCQFFSFGVRVPVSIDVNPSNLWKLAYHFPPTGSFQVLNWLGIAYLPQPLNPLGIAAALLSPWWFFTTYEPVIATLALLAMAAFLRELELPRPAALFGAVIYAWQGDLLTFVYPGHYGYIATWPFYALAAWAALRARRTDYWPYAVISGVSCGLMVGLQPDRGGIACLLIAALYAAPGHWLRTRPDWIDYLHRLRHLALCVLTAFLVALAPLLALYQANIAGVKLGGEANRNHVYGMVTEFSLGPPETLTYLVPGLFGWHSSNQDGPYWGWVGESPDYPGQNDRFIAGQGAAPRSQRNFNLAISTIGTVASFLALVGILLILPGRLAGPASLTPRQYFYGRLLLVLGLVTLVLSWGWHTPIYQYLFQFPLMDKWRDPLKWLEMTNFALVVLAAYGMQHLLASLDPAAPATKIIRSRLTGFSLGLLLLLLLGLIASYPIAIVLAARLNNEQFDHPALAAIMATMHLSLTWAIALVILFCLLLWGFWRPDLLRAGKVENPLLDRLWRKILTPENLPLTCMLSVALLGVIQLAWVATQFITPLPLAVLTETNPLLEALRDEGDRVRVSVYAQDPMLNALLQNQFAADRIPCLEVSAASRIPDDLQQFLQTMNGHQARKWFLAGVKNVVLPQQFFTQMRQDPDIAANIDQNHVVGYVLQATDSPDLPSHAVVGMKDYLAKATLVPRAEFFPTDDALLKRLVDPAWNPRDTILLPTGIPVPPPAAAAGPASGPDTVDLQTYTPTLIRAQVQSDQGGYLLINDQYDPDWHVQVNGQPATLLRADYILRAVPVPPGASAVTMQYTAHYHPAGLHLPAQAVNDFSDASMLAAWLIALVALVRRRSR
jgi:hypothetical protein